MKQSVGYVALVVRDYDEAIGFYVGYAGVLRWSKTLASEAQNKRWVLVAPPGSHGMPGVACTGVSVKEQSSRVGNQTGGRVFLFLHTDDFWRDFESYKSKGVVFVREPKGGELAEQSRCSRICTAICGTCCSSNNKRDREGCTRNHESTSD